MSTHTHFAAKVATLLMLCTTNATAGNICKGAWVTQDAMADSVSIDHTPVAFTTDIPLLENNVQIQLRLQGGQPQMAISTREWASVDVTVPTGSPLLVRFDEDEPLELMTARSSTSNSGVLGEGQYARIYTVVPFQFDITPELLTTMTAKNLTVIRLPVSDGSTRDWRPSRTFQKRIQRLAQCIHEHYPSGAE